MTKISKSVALSLEHLNRIEKRKRKNNDSFSGVMHKILVQYFAAYDAREQSEQETDVEYAECSNCDASGIAAHVALQKLDNKCPSCDEELDNPLIDEVDDILNAEAEVKNSE